MFGIGVNWTQTWTASEQPPYAPGNMLMDQNGRAFVFVRCHATNALTEGWACVVHEDFLAARLDVNANTAPNAGQGLPVGLACANIPANGYGWVQRNGVSVVDGHCLTGCVKHTIINATATVGTVDDNAVAGNEVIEGLTLYDDEASLRAPMMLVWPYVGRTL